MSNPKQCPRCHGEPYIHKSDDKAGNPYSGRCQECAAGKALARRDYFRDRYHTRKVK